MGYSDLDWKAINTIRLLAVCFLPRHPTATTGLFTDMLQVDATLKANSGHPGAPMGKQQLMHAQKED